MCVCVTAIRLCHLSYGVLRSLGKETSAAHMRALTDHLISLWRSHMVALSQPGPRSPSGDNFPYYVASRLRGAVAPKRRTFLNTEGQGRRSDAGDMCKCPSCVPRRRDKMLLKPLLQCLSLAWRFAGSFSAIMSAHRLVEKRQVKRWARDRSPRAPAKCSQITSNSMPDLGGASGERPTIPSPRALTMYVSPSTSSVITATAGVSDGQD